MPDVHHLKIHTKYFQAVKSGDKPFEVRKNDRKFKVGDTLILDEYNPIKNIITGAWVPELVTYILDDPEYVKEGYVILGIKEIVR